MCVEYSLPNANVGFYALIVVDGPMNRTSDWTGGLSRSLIAIPQGR